MAKRTFKKVWLVVEDNKMFGQHGYEMVNMFRRKEYANKICQQQNQRAKSESQMLYNQNKPMPEYKLHGYYLVHESYFDDENK